jgi:hypothetical protein
MASATAQCDSGILLGEDSMTKTQDNPDNDLHKGAVEDDQPQQEHNTSLRGQLGHRNQDEMLKDNDTDYPEPGENPEHSGEKVKKGSGD